MLRKAEWKKIFAPNGHLVRKGDLISRPAYSKTLQSIADNGADIFYHVNEVKRLSFMHHN